MSVDYVKLGIRVRIRRENLRMSQAEVASAAGISIQHVSNIENAKTKVSLERIVDISSVLHNDMVFSSISNPNLAAN